MKVKELMSTSISSCHATESLNDAARLMWERDVGFVPVVDSSSSSLLGVVTDRDICMAAYLRGLPLCEIDVSSAMNHSPIVCREADDLTTAQELMASNQLHRLPVINAAGRLVGILTINDLARAAAMKKTNGRLDVPTTLAEITRPRSTGGTHAADLTRAPRSTLAARG